MILPQPNSPFSCTLHSHLAPCYYSLHLPSPPHSLTMETPHQEMCSSTSSPISQVTPLPSSNTLTCLIMLIKIKLLLPRDGGTRGKSEMSTPALSPSPGRWLSLGSPLGGKCSRPEPRPNIAGPWEMAGCRAGREDAVGVLTSSYCFCSRGSGGHLKVDQKHQLHLHYLDGFPPIFITCLACFVHMQSLLIYYIQTQIWSL